ncbi:MAG: ATPase [bacterium]|nr:MAG: ATPase [bacterium]
MTRHSIDVSTRFPTEEEYNNLPPEQEVEDINQQLDIISKADFNNVKKTRIKKEPYALDDSLIKAVKLSIALARPLLLQGEPGCGKTRLAYAVAYALNLPLEECYIKSTSRAQDLLYTYDAVNRLYESQLPNNANTSNKEETKKLDIKNFIKLGPLGRAIACAQAGRRCVVLIDEIDKADLDFPNDLLYELDRLEFRVSEAPEIHYKASDTPSLRPIIFVTHNEEKALPTAFLRRCIFHYIEFPKDKLNTILKRHGIGDDPLSQEAIKIILQLRDPTKTPSLAKNPGLSELIDWVGYAKAVKTPLEELKNLPHIGALLKQDRDQKIASKKLNNNS